MAHEYRSKWLPSIHKTVLALQGLWGFYCLKNNRASSRVIRIIVTFYFRSWSEYKHWMEFWRRIWIGNSTNHYSGAGWYVCCVPRRNEFEIQIRTDALLYQIFLLFMLSHRCSAPGTYAWPVHPDRCEIFITTKLVYSEKLPMMLNLICILPYCCLRARLPVCPQ